MKSKTIILSSQNSSGRGILTIYTEDGLLKCRMRLYNVEKLNKFCKLGIYHNQEVFSGNLIEKDGAYHSSMVGDFDIDKDFYTAIINTQLNNFVVLSGGTYAGHFVNDDTIFSSLEVPQTSTNLINPIVEKQEQIECNNQCDKCSNCIYKEYFYSHQPKEEQEQQPTTTKETQNTEQIQLIKSLTPQLEYIFNNHPENTELTSLLENSKFAEISEENSTYSVGAIYENEKIKYICYAVKSTYNTPPPEEIGKNYQWLPINKLDPLTDGYYIVFQDTTDFKIIEF